MKRWWCCVFSVSYVQRSTWKYLKHIALSSTDTAAVPAAGWGRAKPALLPRWPCSPRSSDSRHTAAAQARRAAERSARKCAAWPLGPTLPFLRCEARRDCLPARGCKCLGAQVPGLEPNAANPQQRTRSIINKMFHFYTQKISTICSIV